MRAYHKIVGLFKQATIILPQKLQECLLIIQHHDMIMHELHLMLLISVKSVLRQQKRYFSSLLQKGVLHLQIFHQIMQWSFLACLGGTGHYVECTKFFPKGDTSHLSACPLIRKLFVKFCNLGRTFSRLGIFFRDISTFLLPEICYHHQILI